MTARTTRRGFLHGAAATAGGVAASGTVGAQASFGGWLSNTSNYDGVADKTGQSEVTITVGAEANGGAFGFAPAAVHVDKGTTVVWEWNGKGGAHNVAGAEGAGFSSGAPVAEAGTTFEHTFEESGTYKYQCDPHASLGMKGVVAVGDVDLGGESGGESGSGGEGGGEPAGPSVPDAAKTVGVAAFIGMLSTLGLAYALLRHGTGAEPTE
ncbi:MAG: halocyanin domain-containing protein [Halobacteriales archaeon]